MWEGSVHTQGTMGPQTPRDAPGPRAPCAERPKAPENRARSSRSVQTRPVGTPGVGRACPLRRQARGWLGSPGGAWLQSEALPRAPAHGPGLGPPKALRRRAGAEPRHGRGSPGPMRPRIRGRQRRGHAGTSPTFSSGGILLLQDDPLPVQTRYGGAKVQGLLLTTLQTKTGHGVTQTGTFWTAACGPATKTGLSQAPRSHRPRDPRSCRLGGLPQRAPEVPRPGGLRPVSNS